MKNQQIDRCGTKPYSKVKQIKSVAEAFDLMLVSKHSGSIDGICFNINLNDEYEFTVIEEVISMESDVNETNDDKGKSDKSESGSDSCCYYVVDSCGCHIDPCGCYASSCCC